MNGLKKTIMGYYHPEEADRLIAKIREDYEACLKNQKQRILELRSENKELSAAVEQIYLNKQYGVDAMRQAEQAANQIIKQAEFEARRLLDEARKEDLQLRAEAAACRRSLLRIKQASEIVYLAACKAVGTEFSTDDMPRAAAHPIVRLK